MNFLRLPTETDASGRDFGEEELELLRQVLQSGTLNCTRGTFVNRLEGEWAQQYGAKHCIAVTSGTAAIWAAVAAIDPEPGDEIVTTSVTDMGAITPILYQSAIPIFADCEPDSLNISARTIERVLTPRTRAIIVTHLFGAPCDMEPIRELARKHNLLIIEDAAQSPFATYRGERTGNIGDIGCFSLQQNKHVTAGEGGLVVTNDDALARRIRLFHDKAWGYGDAQPDHYFLAPNLRLTELQAAVVLPQLARVEAGVARRQTNATWLSDRIASVPGLAAQTMPAESKSAWWKFAVWIDEDEIPGGADALGAQLRQNFGLMSAPRYIQKPAFECEVLRDRRTFGNSQFPFEGAHRAGLAPIEYRPEDFTGTYAGLRRVLVLPWNEHYTDEHLEYVAHALESGVASLRSGKAAGTVSK
ncbi:MAG TPA: DegT/DnrJ/EryC1/StrS family aminotransferase [Abditibacteriaceae bacterium]